MWDDDYLYIGVVVVSSDHRNNKRNAHIWEDDSLSLKLGLATNQNAEYRFIFSLGGGNIPLGYLLCLPNETLEGTSIPLEILLHYSDYCVARTDNETTYEIRIKWEDYTVDERRIEKGFQFYLEVGLNTKGKKAATPRTMVYGTYDDSKQWQYPQITLDEQDAILSPTPELIPTATTTDSLGLIRSPSVTAVASASLKTPKENSDTYLWWCLLFLILLELFAVIILIKIKKCNRTSH